MLNVGTFKKFCLKAGTKKADEIHDYYIRLEQTLHWKSFSGSIPHYAFSAIKNGTKKKT